MKFYFFTLLLFFTQISFSQIVLKPMKDLPNYEHLMVRYDSIMGVKIHPDTISYYTIAQVDTFDTFYVIQAHRKINKTTYYYRIKSPFPRSTTNNNCIQKIELGKTFQLDLRDFDNHNQRIHFIPGVALGLVTHGGSSDFKGHHDIVVMRDDQMTKDEFNIALNLNGL